jgi:Dyp-type peroxidase family
MKQSNTSSGINLNAPLAWTNASPDEQKMLQKLQGNILKGHGRNFTANIFFRFGDDKTKSKRLLRELANYHITDAHRQLLDAQQFKKTGVGGSAFCHLALSHKGYTALDLLNVAPQDEDFVKGMQHEGSIEALHDPNVCDWESDFQGEIHGLLLVAHESEYEILKLTRDVFAPLLEKAGCSFHFTQEGKAVHNKAGEGIEHFGYVDGRSQPLMLWEDIASESKNGGISSWDPAFPLATALVEDPGANDNLSFGSYFIFRKLEQLVQDFKRREQEAADLLGFNGGEDSEDRELAGAMIVGRFEDGTPVTLSNGAQAKKPPNNFNYDGDAGTRCPFHAHIRKVNPRGTGGFESRADERIHLMARRGIPFEDSERRVHPDDLPETNSLAEFEEKVAPLLPTGGLGLLFMAYNNTIANQFKFTQQNWANNPNFPNQLGAINLGIDPVIGQVGEDHNLGDQLLPKNWDSSAAEKVSCPFAGFVKMKGGEYFFSPSLTFFKNL